MVAQLLRRMRLQVARAMHPSRHEHALGIVRAHSDARAILVMCHGNICRSPFAAAVLEHRVRPRGVRVISAGFIGPGRPPPTVALAAGSAHGFDLRTHRSQLVTPALLGQVDLVVVMDAHQRATLHHDYGVREDDVLLLGDLDPASIPGRGIADPYDRPLAEFEEVFTRIERCLGVLVDALAGLPEVRRPGMSSADPSRTGRRQQVV